MCCFTSEVDVVADTNIFARGEDGSVNQFLVYSMSYAASQDLAMVLPLPKSAKVTSAKRCMCNPAVPDQFNVDEDWPDLQGDTSKHAEKLLAKINAVFE